MLREGKSVKFAEKQPFERRRTGSPTVLALAVAAALAGTAPALAEAAGLGRLTVQSALGQPLRAEVEVTALGRDEAGSLSARLASPEAFRQAGLEFNSALTGLRFAVDRRTNGAPVVRITSSQPINEPFVDLLVELNWAAGKFVREYTFLLDPPELRVGRESVAGGPSQIVPATTAGVAAAPAQVAQAAPDAASGTVAPPPPAAPARAATRSAAAAPASARAATAAPAAATQADAAPAGAGNEVTVRQGETLATIAARVKPADVSLEQAIIAIYNANPRAFFGSVHQMLAGARLAVPDRSTMTAVDAGEARRQIREQAAVFNAYRERLAAAARRVEPARAGQSATGSVTAQVQDSAAGAGAGDQLKLSRPEGGAAGAGSATGSSAAASAAEGRVARDAAVREQQDRIAALEKNVVDLQQLLELKNRQLAEMQKQVESARAAATTASGAVGAAAGAAGDSAATGSAAAPGTVAQAPSSAAAPAAGTSPSAEAGSGGSTDAAAGGSAAAPPSADAASAAATGGAASGTETPAAAPAPAATASPASAPSPAPAAEPGFFEQLADNPLVLPGAAAIVLALGAYGLYAVRRRKKSDKFEDSLIAADAFTANSLFGSTGGQTVDTNNSLFPASGRDSGVDVHSTEVDPIAEAEVYIAYGREAQAEEILKEALKKQPERQAIRLKLLEIHAGRKDAVAFAAVAQEMYDMTGGQNEEWPKVVTLGLSIDPANPLYTGQGDGASSAPSGDGQAAPPSAAGAAALSAAATAAAAVLGDRLAPASGAEVAAPAVGGTFAETVPMDGEQAGGTVDEVPALDFDLDLDTTIGRAVDRRTADAAVSQPTPADSDLSRAIDGRFDLPSLDIGVPTQASAEEPQALADLGDFKIDLPALEGLDTQPAAEEPAALDEMPAIDFGDVDFGSADGHGSAHELSGGELGLATADAAVASGADSSRWQEMATKLDLASAYEEIGDKEGARELLEEVLRGGDLTQQQKARSMLAKIG